ncbi:TrlF family AAA-like ATPase [Sphingobacterium faecium]|uniref:TrlF family AAA-like ATPase n=1 Tax=Sphingobacterium faecium TaxID=34087 RepID=UPI0032090F1E
MVNKGSQWRKWNFHIHTKGTNKNDQFSSKTMDDFFYTFFKKAYENKISAIAVTDYFSIERYLEAIEYRNAIEDKEDWLGEKFSQEEVRFIKDIFIFPNVELRMLPSTDKGRLINIHCLFNPDYVTDLENDFFSHIENQDGIKMNRHGIISYGQSLYPDITHIDKQYGKGLDNFVIDLKSLRELISTNKKFRDNTILVVSNSNNDGASGTQKHFDLFENENGSLDGLRKSIYQISDAIFSANPKDVKYFIGKRLEGSDGYNEQVYKQEVEGVIKNRGSLKPCIVGCDAHKEDDLFTKFTWVKSDLNFEGLRQICFEPEQRVKIQNEVPDFKEEKLIIEQVSFISPGKVFSTLPVYLNPNLNVIIGGKSSGKSILLYAIAKTLSADETVLKNEDGTDKYDLKKIDNAFDFQITTKGGFTQKLIRAQDENSILPEIKYIPQNYLVKLAEPELNKKGKSLNKLVRDLIIEDDNSKELYNDFIFKVSQNDKLRNSNIDLYFETQNEIATLETELKTKSNKTVLEKNIETNTLKVEELNKSTGLTPVQVEEYKALQAKLESNNTKLQGFKDDFSAIQSFNNELSQSLKSLKQRKDTLIGQLQLKEIKEFYQTAYTDLDILLEMINNISASIEVQINEHGQRSFTNDSVFRNVLYNINLEQKTTNESIQPYLKDEQVKKSIDILNNSISNDKKSLLDIANLSKKINDKKILLNETKNEIFTIYKNSYNEYLNVISILKDRTIELEKDGLGIIGKAQFNYAKLWKEIYSISDGRTASYNLYSILGANKKATDHTDFDFILKEVMRLFDDLITKKYVLTNRASIQTAVKLILDDYFFDYWDITYKSDKLGEMSTGKASFVILMLIIGLSKSKAPILIDQPEDNLDNRSITTDLVNYLRIKKLDRQIIIVTHNANIVVNADAENVIVANQKGQNEEQSTSPFKFDYTNGAIENSFDKKILETDLLKSMGIRQHIADIVEGGKDAFIMREKKYRFH